MKDFNDILNKLSIEDIEKLKMLLSIGKINQPGEAVTLRVFRTEYEEYARSEKSVDYQTSIKTSFDHLFQFFDKRKLISQISNKDAEDFIISLRRKTPKGYRVYYRTLKAAFNKAVIWEYISENPFIKIKLPKQQKLKPEFINEKELNIICSQIANETIKNIAITTFYTGLRLGEILSLSWRNVDLSERLLTIGDTNFTTKTKEQRFIPMSEAVVEILKKIKIKIQTEKKPSQDKYIFVKDDGFPYSKDYVSKVFKKAVRKANLRETIHFHTLRHSFASYLAQKGVGMVTIQELLGHKSVIVTQIYAHTNLETLREAVDLFNEPFSKRKVA